VGLSLRRPAGDCSPRGLPPSTTGGARVGGLLLADRTRRRFVIEAEAHARRGSCAVHGALRSGSGVHVQRADHAPIRVLASGRIGDTERSNGVSGSGLHVLGADHSPIPERPSHHLPLRQPRVARMLLPPPLHPRLRRHPATQRPTAPMARQLIMEHGLNGDDSAPLCRRSPSRPVHSWSHRRSRQGSERSARDPGQSESNPKITFAADLLSLSGSSETQARGASFARFATHHHHREIPCARLCAVVRG